MADKPVSVLGIVVAIATSVTSALIIKECTDPGPGPAPAADVSITAFDVAAVPFIGAGDAIQPRVEVYNRGSALAEQCAVKVGLTVTTTDGGNLLVLSPSRQFSVPAGETRELLLSAQVPAHATGTSSARAILQCQDLPPSEVKRTFSIVSGT